MNELIRIEEKEGKQTVSARELYSGLIEGSERFSKWWNRMISYGYTENEDYFRVYQKVRANRYGGEQKLQDYAISINMAKELCMIQKNEKGKQFRLYFIECEKKMYKLVSMEKPYVARVESAKLLHQIGNEYGGKSETYKQILDAYATKEITGEFLLPLPELEKKTYSATEIGKLLGVSAQKVGSIANRLNLKSSEYGKFFMDKSPYSAKEVETFRYYENAIDLIKKSLG